jgi:hypothetical protein
MIPAIGLAVWIRSSLNRFMAAALVFYALKHKENVATKYENGTFELIATGTPPTKLN